MVMATTLPRCAQPTAGPRGPCSGRCHAAGLCRVSASLAWKLLPSLSRPHGAVSKGLTWRPLSHASTPQQRHTTAFERENPPLNAFSNCSGAEENCLGLRSKTRLLG